MKKLLKLVIGLLLLSPLVFAEEEQITDASFRPAITIGVHPVLASVHSLGGVSLLPNIIVIKPTGLAGGGGGGGGGGATLNANTFTDTQTIALSGANKSWLVGTGYSLTGSSTVSAFDWTGSWNTSGVPTLFKFNLTNTGCGTNCKFLDFQLAGTSTAALLIPGTNAAAQGGGLVSNPGFQLVNGVDTLQLSADNQFTASISTTYTLMLRQTAGVGIQGPGAGVAGVLVSNPVPNGLAMDRRSIVWGRHAGALDSTPTPAIGPVTIGITTHADDVAITSMQIVGQTALPAGASFLVGGPINLIGGDGASGSSGLATGGAITLDGGIGYGTGTAGDITVGATRGNLIISPSKLTVATATAAKNGVDRSVWSRADLTNAVVVALGATTTGDIKMFTLPAKTVVRNAYFVLLTADSSANALTVACGRTAASYIDYIVASDAKAGANVVYGDASAERGTNLVGYDMPSFTATTDVFCHFIKTTTNLNTVTSFTGSLYLATDVLP